MGIFWLPFFERLINILGRVVRFWIELPLCSYFFFRTTWGRRNWWSSLRKIIWKATWYWLRKRRRRSSWIQRKKTKMSYRTHALLWRTSLVQIVTSSSMFWVEITGPNPTAVHHNKIPTVFFFFCEDNHAGRDGSCSSFGRRQYNIQRSKSPQKKRK